MRIFSRLFKNYWPFLVIILVTVIFFWKFFFKGLLPIPADIIPGTYLPWFDLRFSDFPAGIPVKNNILSDVVSVMYPWRKLAIDLMKSGIAPLWNPYILSGNVLLANFQSAAFYPLNIVYWLVSDFSIAWSLQIIFQPLLAAFFMYVFLRNTKLSKLSSLFGSLVWGFSGFFMVWLEYNTLVQASLYFPLILFSVQKSIENKKYYLLLTLAVALSFYASYPQITFYELFFAGLFTIIVLKKIQLKDYLRLVIYVLLGIGLAFPILIPGYEAAKYSIRLVDNVANMSHVKFVLPEQIVTFVAPDFFGNPVSRNYWLVNGAYENAVLFAGVSVFVLFLISFFLDKKDKTKLLYYSWFVFFIAAVLAFKNPLSELLGNSKILLFSSSVMGRLVFIIMFAFSISSSIVLDLFLKNKMVLKKLLIPVGFTAILIFAYGGYAYLNHNNVALRNLVLPTLMLFVVTILLTMLVKLKKFKYLIITLFILVELFDLYRFHDKYNPFSPSEFLYPRTAVTDYLISQKPGRFESEDAPIIPPNMWMPYNLYTSSGQDAVHSLRYNKFLGLVNTGKFMAGDRYTRLVNYNSPLFDFLGITNVAVAKWKNAWLDFEGVASYKFDNPKFEKVFEDGRSLILKNKKAYPRMFTVQKYVLAKTDAEFEKLLKSENLRETAILEDIPDTNLSKADVKISNETYEPMFTSADITSSGSSMLVVTQSNFPGWKAYIDGVETKLYRADYDFMAIIIPNGNHRLMIKYEPESFRLGLIGGGASAILLIISCIFLRKKNIRVS